MTKINNWKESFVINQAKSEYMIKIDSSIFDRNMKEARIRRDIYVSMFVASMVTFLVFLMNVRMSL